MINEEYLSHIFVGPKSRHEPVTVVADPTLHVNDSSQSPEAKEWQEIQDGDIHVTPVSLRNLGSSNKAIFETPHGDRWIAKAYHQPLSREITHYDTGGWAECATQALHRAGGIGELCQRSVVCRPEQPIIATKFVKAAKHYDPDDVGSAAQCAALSLDAAKIGFVDFLTNNVDRCSTNFLTKQDAITGHPVGLYAIDHAANFQYLMPNIFGSQVSTDSHDHLHEYLRGEDDWAAFARLHAATTPYVEHAVKWWQENGPYIRREMERQLTSIVDPAVKDHIYRNFTERADCLDRLAFEWPEHRDWSMFHGEGSLSNLVDAQLHRFKR